MASIRMIDPMEVEAQKPPQQITLRQRQVIRNILADVVGGDTSTVIEQISDYLKYKDCDFQIAQLIQDDERWLKVSVVVGQVGTTCFEKHTRYEFKVRHPKNPSPGANHDLPRN